MKTLNRVFLIGAVGKDPDIRSTAGGVVVASLSLATSERLKDQTGQWVDKTEWHSLVAFARTAEVIRDYVTKGSPLHVEGRLQTRSWDDKDSGQKRYKTEIVVENLILLGTKDAAKNQRPHSQSAPKAEPVEYSPFGEVDEDSIPF